MTEDVGSHWRDYGSAFPHRVVDAEDQGWYLCGDGLYHADYGTDRGLEPRPYDQLAGERGRLRPVLPVTDEDEVAIRAALTEAGTKAAASVAVGLYAVFDLYKPHRRRLLAGREGSWESAGLPYIAWEIGSRIAEKAGGGRVHAGAATCVAALIGQWVTDPDRYTEVAETLAFIFGQVADAAGGWDKVADRYLQPGGRWSQNGTKTLYGYLMSTAETLDTGLL